MKKGVYGKYLLEIANTPYLSEEDTRNKFNEMLTEICTPKKSKFYRYRPLNEYTIFELLQGYVFLSNPNAFNDLFDCNAHLQLGELSKSYGEWILDLQHFENVSNSLALKKTMEIRKDIISKKLKIACFTTKNNNVSMWDRYANEHKGICIEYDFENIFYENNKLKCNGEEYEHELFLPVFYTKKFNKYLVAMNRPDLTRVSCLVNSILKHTDWGTEDEWRLTSYNNDVTEFKGFPIKSIYFGAKTSDIMINKLIDLLKDDKRKIEFFKMYETTSGLKYKKC